MQVPWLERTNFSRRYSSRSPASVSTWMRLAVTLVTTPGRRAVTTWPESRAARASMPVPTMGASGARGGTASRCMLVTLVIQPGVGLGDVALLFVGGVEVDDLVGDARPDGEGIGLLLLQLGHGLLREALALLEDDRAGPGDEVGVGDLALALQTVPARAALHLAGGGFDEAGSIVAAAGGGRGAG